MGTGTEQARPNLDEIRRDLFHAEGDKVCAGRLIHRHAPALLVEVEWLRHIARLAGDVLEQIHPDVDWDGVPPWTMDTVERLRHELWRFDEADTDG